MVSGLIQHNYIKPTPFFHYNLAMPPPHQSGEGRPLPTTPTTFPIQKLAVEIQMQIWEYATFDLPPRIVEVSYRKRGPRLVSPTLVPPMLHLCSASRRIGLQRYQPLIFGTYSTGTFVDWEMDTIFFNEGFDLSVGGFYGKLEQSVASILFSSCKNVAMGAETLQDYLTYCAYLGTEGDFPFMDFSALCGVSEVSSNCPNGEGNLSFFRHEAHEIVTAAFYPHYHNRPLLRLGSIKHDLSSRANRDVQCWIAEADRGYERRLKGNAKALKWEGKA